MAEITLENTIFKRTFLFPYQTIIQVIKIFFYLVLNLWDSFIVKHFTKTELHLKKGSQLFSAII